MTRGGVGWGRGSGRQGRWSESKKGFTVDPHNTPDGRAYAEHALPGLRVTALPAGG